MKKKFSGIAGACMSVASLAVLAASVFVLTSCLTLSSGESLEETEISKKFADAAVTLILTREDGMTRKIFETAFKKQFPGVENFAYGQTPTALGVAGAIVGTGHYDYGADFDYEGKSYRLDFAFSEKKSEYGGDTLDRLTGVKSCKEKVKKPAS